MAVYMYRAKSAFGKEEKGKLEANNEMHLKSLLREKKLFLLSYKKETTMNKDIEIGFLSKVKLRELAIFARQFSAMINAGLTVVAAVDIMKTQVQNKKLRTALETAAEDVRKGSALSESLTKFPDIFPDIFVNMIEAGELSGKLDTSLERAAEHFEKENAISGKVKGAMTYPLVVTVVAFIAIGFLIAVVIPGFLQVFEELDTELPITTKILIGLSDFLRNYWYLAILGVIGVIVGYKMYYKTPNGRVAVDRIKLKIPVFGPLGEKVAASRFARTLATMLEAGLPLLSAIDITAKVIDNAFIEKKLSSVRDEVSRGSGLAIPLQNIGVFPLMITHMVSVGENTGEVESLLKKAAVLYDDEVDLAVKQLTTALEPFIIIILGGAICFIVLSILQPMFTMYQSVSNM